MAPAITKSRKKRTTEKWRKTADVQDVEEGLEELRTELIQGGAIKTRDSKDLFFVDTKGNDAILQEYKKGLKMDEIINKKSAIDAVSLKLPKTTTTKVDVGHKTRNISKHIKQTIEKKASIFVKKGVKPGDAVKERQKKIQEKKQQMKLAKGGYDLWGAEKPVVIEPYLEEVIKKPVKKPLVQIKKPLAIPSVVVTHAGNSYKPDLKDHQEAMQIAANEEIVKLEKKEAIAKALSYPPELDDLPDETFLDDDSEEDEEEEEKELENQTEATKKKVSKKTKTDLNRQKRHKELLLKEQIAQEDKKIMKQINKIKELEKELLEKDIKDKEQQELRQKIQELKGDTETKKLSRFNFHPTPMEIQLPDEIADTLRQLKPEGNLITDRFKSMEARNIIETRIPVKRKRRYKMKMIESHDYKRFK